jgi:hypothetical protein
VLVPAGNAIVGIDLADKKQMVVVCDHDSKVLARKTFRCRAWDLGAALDWAADRAAAKGFAGVAELGLHRARDGSVDVGVFEHDERRVATQLHRRPQYPRRSLSQ